MPRAYLEITGAVVRLGGDDYQELGSDFDLTLALVGDHGTAVIKGVNTDRLTPAQARAVSDELLRCGFSHVAWWRHKAGAEMVLRRYRLRVRG